MTQNSGAFRNNLLTVATNLIGVVVIWNVLRRGGDISHDRVMNGVGVALLCLGVLGVLVPPLLLKLKGYEAVKRSGRSVPGDMLVSTGSVALGIALLGRTGPVLTGTLLVGIGCISIIGGVLALRARRTSTL